MVLIFLKGVTTGFKEFGEVIAWLVSFVLLSLVYFLGVGTTSLLAKIVGKHFLNTKEQKNKKTYYEELNLSKEPKDSYYRQF